MVLLAALLSLLAGVGCRGALSDDTTQARRRAADSTLAAAQAALEQGRPWHASQLLAPLLADTASRTPEIQLAAARAAAGWRGWTEIRRILDGAGWVDTAFDGGGNELLARAALALGDDSTAMRQAQRAREAAGGDVRAHRRVLLARVYDRIGANDSAAAEYLRAAEALPEIGDWLRLRALAVTRDSAARAGLAAAIGDPFVRGRVPLAEARAWERAGDTARAITAYTTAEPLGALRLRLAIHDSSARDAAIEFIRDRSGSIAARDASQYLRASAFKLRPSEWLIVARSGVRTGPLPDAVSAYESAFAAGVGTAEDRFEYAAVLARLGRHDAAVREYRKIRAPRGLATSAGFRAARSLVRSGRITEGTAALRSLIRRNPNDTATAVARYLLADLATDDLRDMEARRLFREIGRRFPSHRLAPVAAFRGATITWTRGPAERAAAEFDSIVRRYPQSEDALAGRYWAGRAWAAAGDSTNARARWREVIGADSATYYAGLSAMRLELEPWKPAPVASPDAEGTPFAAAAARAVLLDRVGMDDEALLERERINREAGRRPDTLLLAAVALERRGYTNQAIRLARRAQDAGAPRTAALYQLLYPLAHGAALRSEAERNTLDPWLMAALIRQESLFDPRATSAAGARGLMQLMPDVGRRIAQAHRIQGWGVELLYEPEVSLELGADHLAELVTRYPTLVEALAAYNAGSSRVERWRTKTGADDPEVLVERIPYVETRDYVRIIVRNVQMYRALYGEDVRREE